MSAIQANGTVQTNSQPGSADSAIADNSFRSLKRAEVAFGAGSFIKVDIANSS